MINSIQKGFTLVFLIWVASVAFSEEDKSTKVIQTEQQYANELVTDPWRNQYPLYNNYGERITGTDY